MGRIEGRVALIPDNIVIPLGFTRALGGPGATVAHKCAGGQVVGWSRSAPGSSWRPAMPSFS